jgi:Family of unknown function (DUF6279)
MQVSRIKRIIIGLLLVVLGPALAGCSAVRLSYANGPQLAWWWLDGYFDFSREHSAQVQQTLDRWFEWHRSTQLAQTTALLAEVAQQMGEPMTPGQVCQWQDRARSHADPALSRAILDFADLMPGMGEAQMKHLEAHYRKLIDEMRRDFLQPDPAERFKSSVKRTRERAERIYGGLGDAQLQVISEGVAASPFDPELWLLERQRRQRDTLQTLRRMLADRADRDQRVAALRALVQRSEQSPNPEYRSYQTRLTAYNCALAAQVHNTTTAAQRRKARDNLRGWADDLRTLLPPA